MTEYVEVMTRNLKQNHRFAENLLKEVVAFTGCELLGWLVCLLTRLQLDMLTSCNV